LRDIDHELSHLVSTPSFQIWSVKSELTELGKFHKLVDILYKIWGFQKNSIQELEGRTGTLRHSHKKSRPAPQPPGPELQIREPSQLLVGVPPTLTAHWRHSPAQLLTSHVTYLAQVRTYTNFSINLFILSTVKFLFAL
jgi:hypothetical protein